MCKRISKKNRAKVIGTTLFLVALMSISVQAASTLSCWSNDESSYVCFTPYDGSYYVYNYSTDSTFLSHFQAARANACTEWNTYLPIGISETSFNYALQYIYGGTHSQLTSSFPTLGTGNTGLTYMAIPDDYTSHTATHEGNLKTVVELTAGGKMCVVQKESTRPVEKYKNTTLHEMGHLFGWYDHSLNTNDVMYTHVSSITTLTERDWRHLKQIYDSFYD